MGVVKDVSKLAVSSYAQIWIPFNSTEIARKCWYDNAMGTFRVVILAHSEKDFPAIREEVERLRQKFNDGLQDTPDMIEKQIDAVFEDIEVDAVKIGMLSTPSRSPERYFPNPSPDGFLCSPEHSKMSFQPLKIF